MLVASRTIHSAMLKVQDCFTRECRSTLATADTPAEEHRDRFPRPDRLARVGATLRRPRMVDPRHARGSAGPLSQRQPARHVHGPLRAAALRRHVRRRRTAGPQVGGGAASPRCRSGRRGRLPAAELGGGGGNLLGIGIPGCGGGPDRPLLRPARSRVHPGHRQTARLHHRRGVRADGVRSRRLRRRAGCRGGAAPASTRWSTPSPWRARWRPTPPAPR